MCLFGEESPGFAYFTLLQIIKNKSKIQENVKNDEKRAYHEKSFSTHQELNHAASNLVGHH